MTSSTPTTAEFVVLLDALNCGAALVDRAGRVVYANERLARMFQRPTVELIGADLLAMYGRDDGAVESLHETLKNFDEPREEETYLPLPGGERLPVVTSASPVKRDDGAPALYRLVTVLDISQQKHAEREMKEQYDIIAKLSNTILDQAMGLKDYSHVLEDRVRERTAELREANFDALYMLAVACEAKDEDTGRHVRRIRDYARMISREIGMGDGESEEIGYSAVLHDVGKMHVPDHILKKPGPLTPDERETIQQHTVMGERILCDNTFFARARRIARSHHENWDGSGYPDRSAGGAIPIEARIVHLADVYDALTTPRVYKHAWSVKDAVGVIRESRGQMFDPEVVGAFESLVSRDELNGNGGTQGV
jgi:PAS domain S-box-containing protein